MFENRKIFGISGWTFDKRYLTLFHHFQWKVDFIPLRFFCIVGCHSQPKITPEISTDVMAMAAVQPGTCSASAIVKNLHSTDDERIQSHCDANYSPFHAMTSARFYLKYPMTKQSWNVQPFFNASTKLIRILVRDILMVRAQAKLHICWDFQIFRFSPLFVVGVLSENRLILRIPSIISLTKKNLF